MRTPWHSSSLVTDPHTYLLTYLLTYLGRRAGPTVNQLSYCVAHHNPSPKPNQGEADRQPATLLRRLPRPDRDRGPRAPPRPRPGARIAACMCMCMCMCICMDMCMCMCLCMCLCMCMCMCMRTARARPLQAWSPLGSGLLTRYLRDAPEAKQACVEVEP
jgi:hypothetical protein